MKLRDYVTFDTKTFITGKEFVIKKSRFNEDKGCITLTVTITKDDDESKNIYESFYVHLIQDTNPDKLNQYPIGSSIVFEQIGKASVWGDYQSNLSLEAVVKVVK